MSAEQAVVTSSSEKAFYKEGRDWEADKVARIERSERRAWTVAGASAFIAVAAVVGMATLAPLKRVVPYVFEVDKATGNVEMVSAADDRAVVGYQELLNKYWAQTYVVARESYYYRLLQTDYDTVLALSSDDVGREFARLYEGPNARDKKLGTGMELRVRILSVSTAEDAFGTKAVVRFEKTPKRAEADLPDKPTYFVATIAFEFKPSMFGKERQLIQNPLGYKVLSYRVSPEITPVTAAGQGSN